MQYFLAGGKAPQIRLEATVTLKVRGFPQDGSIEDPMTALEDALHQGVKVAVDELRHGHKS